MQQGLAVQAAQPSTFDAIETIADRGKTLCLLIRTSALPLATAFLTPADFSLQVGYASHSRQHTITRHVHAPIRRQITGTSEVVIIRKGRCQLDVYNESRVLIATRELGPGDIMVMASGGHGYRMIEDTVLLEIKQGPYRGVSEREQF